MFFSRVAASAERRSSASPCDSKISGRGYASTGCYTSNDVPDIETNPGVYFTSVTHKRLPIFRTDILKQVLCDAYREACDRHRILLLAYVIMADHTHLLAYADREMDEVLRLLNGVAAKRVIDYLKRNGFEDSLFKLRGEVRGRNHRHSV